jgi:hypothetical protein
MVEARSAQRERCGLRLLRAICHPGRREGSALEKQILRVAQDTENTYGLTGAGSATIASDDPSGLSANRVICVSPSALKSAT